MFWFERLPQDWHPWIETSHQGRVAGLKYKGYPASEQQICQRQRITQFKSHVENGRAQVVFFNQPERFIKFPRGANNRTTSILKKTAQAHGYDGIILDHKYSSALERQL